MQNIDIKVKKDLLKMTKSHLYQKTKMNIYQSWASGKLSRQRGRNVRQNHRIINDRIGNYAAYIAAINVLPFYPLQ